MVLPNKRNVSIARPSTGDEEWQALKEPIETGWLTQGPKVAGFERAFAESHRVKHALAVTSATTGLHLALAALGVGPGDEVIVPSFTWIATANVILYCGATPVFCDVDRTTFNVTSAEIAKQISPRTKAVIPVHLFGLCADIDGIRAVLPPGVGIVEDAACAAGAKLGDRFAGGLGDFGVFSFHPRKSITTGEGGMVTTNRDDLAELAQLMRNHGASIAEEQRHIGPRPYIMADFNLLGFNYRMTDLQGAVGLVQLKKLERFVTERARWAAYYREHLADLRWLRLPQEPEFGRHAWQAFVTYVDPDTAPVPRNRMMEQLQDAGIATRQGTHAVHMLNFYRDRFGLKPDDFPASRDSDRQSMAIPLHNRLTREDYDYVIENLRSFGR